MRIPLPTFFQKYGMASILVVGVGKISVLSLSLHSIFSVTVFWIDSDVTKFVYRPSKSLSMEVSEAGPFKFIANNRYGRREVACEFMKASNGE